MTKPKYTVIAPIYNEIENIPHLYARVCEVMDQTGEAWELILVDDGSKDGSTDALRELGKRMTVCAPSSSRVILAIKSR